jgi:DNA-binding NarL/FixJ family response regulator
VLPERPSRPQPKTNRDVLAGGNMSVSRTCPTCGYTAAYASDAVADHHHPRHSCARQRRRADAARLRAQRETDGSMRDCRHHGSPHRHGTRTAYVKDQCRCTACRAANSEASRTAYRQRALGRWQPLIDAAPTRAHIEALRKAGVGVDQIARLAGISASHVRELVPHPRSHRPPTQRIRPETARRVLAIRVTAANRAPRSHVDAMGTRRRLQSLIAIGWTQARLAAELRRSASNLQRTMTSKAVTAHTAAQVTALYARLWNRPPRHTTNADYASIEAARALAAAQGWQPPLAWDDIDADPEPHHAQLSAATDEADLDEIAIERAVAGDGIRLVHLTLAEQDEVIRRLTEQGRSIRDIAEQLGTTKRTVSRRRRSVNAA